MDDRIVVAVVGDHNVLVSAARDNGEASGVLCVKFTNRFYVHMKFIGLDKWDGQKRRIVLCYRQDGGHLGLGELALSRAQALTGLLHVPAEGLGRVGTVFSSVLVGETRPWVLVAIFDGG